MDSLSNIECKFKDKCNKPNCKFKHQTFNGLSPASLQQFVATAPQEQNQQKQKQECKYKLNCLRSDCFFVHPTPNGKSPTHPSNSGQAQFGSNPGRGRAKGRGSVDHHSNMQNNQDSSGQGRGRGKIFGTPFDTASAGQIGRGGHPISIGRAWHGGHQGFHHSQIDQSHNPMLVLNQGSSFIPPTSGQQFGQQKKQQQSQSSVMSQANFEHVQLGENDSVFQLDSTSSDSDKSIHSNLSGSGASPNKPKWQKKKQKKIDIQKKILMKSESTFDKQQRDIMKITFVYGITLAKILRIKKTLTDLKEKYKSAFAKQFKIKAVEKNQEKSVIKLLINDLNFKECYEELQKLDNLHYSYIKLIRGINWSETYEKVKTMSKQNKYSVYSEINKREAIILLVCQQSEQNQAKIMQTAMIKEMAGKEQQFRILGVIEKSPIQRYLAYCFLQANQHILSGICQALFLQQNITYNEKLHSVMVEVSRGKKEELRAALKQKAQWKLLEISVPDTFFNIFDKKATAFKEKLETKFQVIIKPKITIQKKSKSGKESSKSQIEEQLPPVSAGSALDMKEFSYKIMIYGSYEGCNAASNEILSFAQSCKRQSFMQKLSQNVADMLTYKEATIQNLQKDTMVSIFYEKNMVVLIGPENRFQEVLQKIQKIIVDPNYNSNLGHQRKTLIFPNVANKDLVWKIVKEMIADKKLERSLNVEIKNYKLMQIILSGPAQNLQQCESEINQMLSKVSNSLITTDICDSKIVDLIPNLGIEKLEKKYKVKLLENKIVLEETKSETQPQGNYYPITNKQIALNSIHYYQWYYKVYSDDANYGSREDKVSDFKKFDPDQNWQIEEQYKFACKQNSFPSKKTIIGDQNQQKNGFIYEIVGNDSNPSNWTERNIEYNKIRPLKRIQLSEQIPSFGMMEEEKSSSTPQNSTRERLRKQYRITGTQDKIISIIGYLQLESLNPLNYQLEYEIPPKLGEQVNIKKYIQLIQDGNLKVTTSIKNGIVTITGYGGKDIQNKLKELEISLQIYEYPHTWVQLENILGENYWQVFELQQQSQEFIQIANQFKLTLPNLTIKKIERIQNRYIWEHYANERKQIKQIIKKDPQVFYLFHGTSKTPPSIIYEGKEGFDKNFSAEGMWGRALYFAVNASYSHNGFRHECSNGDNQLFYAKVLVGDFTEKGPDSSLQMPPLISGSNIRYNSVKGHTGGSDVYMVYHNKQTYPEYLITYK